MIIKPYHLLISILITGCAPKIINTSTTTERDSTAVKTIHHHDTVRIAGETVFINKIIHDTVSFTQTIKEGRATEVLTNRHGQLTAKCKCDSIQKALDFTLKDTTRYKFKESIITRTVYRDKPLTDFDKFCRGFVIVIFALGLGFAIYKFRKFIPFI